MSGARADKSRAGLLGARDGFAVVTQINGTLSKDCAGQVASGTPALP